jgi:hypothetical protein
MSVEATWDLLANYSPRSFCLLSPPAATAATPTAGSRNPFESPSPATSSAASSKSRQDVAAVVYGTERGSLHYRCYPVTVGRNSKASNRGSLSTAAAAGTPRQPLGLSGSSTTASIGGSASRSTPLPRIYFPVDLKSPFLPGSIVSVLPCQNPPPPASFAYGSANATSWLFLVLVDDQRGTSVSQPGAYAAHWVSLHHGSFHVLNANLPRMSSAAVDGGLVFYTSGRSVACFVPPVLQEDGSVTVANVGGTRRIYASPSSLGGRPLRFGKEVWPSAARAGSDALAVVCGGKVVVACVGNAFYAAGGVESDDEPNSTAHKRSVESVKLIHLAQSSQVHPVLIEELPDPSLSADWTALFLANGRECAVVDVYYGPVSQPRLSCDKPRTGTVTTASPILAASASWPQLLVLLTSDGLISVRSPSCLAVSLRTVEVGTRPNDFFALRSLLPLSAWTSPWILSASYTGEARVLEGRPDTAQDLADRLMRHAIDAFGANGFPRTQLATAVQASFTATSYVGPEVNPPARLLLKDYLEALLGLCDWESGASSGWPTEYAIQSAGGSSEEGFHHGRFRLSEGGGRGEDATSLSMAIRKSVVTANEPVALLIATALLCLVSTQLNPPGAAIASRAAKSCASQMGVVVIDGENKGSGILAVSSASTPEMTDATVALCEEVVEKLLREAMNFSLVRSSTPNPISRIHRPAASLHSDFVEASIWLLRSCGQHEMAIQVAAERLQPSPKNTVENADRKGLWSRIKYESYTATHLSELWASGKDSGRAIVLRSPATLRLLESNPPLGLSVFTAQHPQNETQWRNLHSRDDPLGQPENVYEVVKLLKTASPQVPYDKEGASYDDGILPLEAGRALAVSYLESAIGINSDRPTEEDEFDMLPGDESHEEHVANFHDELSFLLLEGVISERSDAVKDDVDTLTGKIYRKKLRQLLRWPLSKVRADQFMSSLPTSFLQEKALLLGRLGKHDEALRILYRDIGSLELALEYCDDRHNQQRAQQEKRARLLQHQQQTNMYSDHDLQRAAGTRDENNAYLPLIRVALETDDAEKGCTAAIQVLALRRSAVDRAAAIRLLPSNIPVSAVARPFLIPALVDSESQVRRLTVVSALLRARYLRLKDELTAAQLVAQANLQVVPQLRSLNLGDPLHSTKPFRARTSGGSSSSTSPEVWIVKHFFPRHLVIQAKVTNQTTLSDKSTRTLSEIAFVVAESSEEAIQPMMQVPIAVLPSKMTGSTWCVLSATPARMEGSTAQLTCELRYTVGQGDPPMMISQSSGMMGRTYVEELQDLEVHASHFS